MRHVAAIIRTKSEAPMRATESPSMHCARHEVTPERVQQISFRIVSANRLLRCYFNATACLALGSKYCCGVLHLVRFVAMKRSTQCFWTSSDKIRDALLVDGHCSSVYTSVRCTHDFLETRAELTAMPRRHVGDKEMRSQTGSSVVRD